MEEQIIQLNLKNLSRRIVLNYMRLNEKVTKAGVAEVTGLTFMAIKKIFSKLEELSLVRSDQYETTAKIGRRVLYYTINEKYGYAVGVHINRFVSRAAVIDLKGKIISEAERDMGVELESQSKCIKMLHSIIAEAIAKSNVDKEKILGIGVGVPGPVDGKKGVLLAPPNFPALAYLPLVDILKEKFHYPVMLQKDTNAIALGEYWNGSGRGCSHIVYIDLDIGIGSGVVVDGKIHVGSNQMAGEFGHVILDVNGPLCTCGNKGCLEALSSGAALIKEFAAALENDEEHPLYKKREELVLQDILKEAEKFDLVAISILNKAALYTGAAINNLINILDPQVIVLGGILVQKNTGYIETIKNMVSEKKMKGAKDSKIVASQLCSQAGVIGAGDIIIDNFFNELVILNKV